MTDTIYEPAYTPSQQARIARLHPSARAAFLEILATMQDAESVDGPEPQQFVRLMEAVIEEAAERRDYCRHHTIG